ncbi:MAG: sodium:proton antiporter [Alistipes sp.]|nr:sodium:proton antiporter [Alistipes sp.]
MQVELWTLIPFALMLLSIAILPLVAEKWWESNLHKFYIVLGLSIPTAIYLIANGMGHNLEHQMLGDYLPFIILLGSLFVTTGGIHIRGDVMATPQVNSLIMIIGFVLASFIGTTGAAMLLIRILLEINQQRKYKVHTVLFFIALVANCGGILTPLGDPPLFMLFLRGADFFWFLSLYGEWLATGGILLLLYFLTDIYFYRKEPTEAIMADMREQSPIKITGGINFIYLILIVCSVAFINPQYIAAMGAEHPPVYIKFLREIVLVILAVLSLITTHKSIRRANNFSWEPINEVAILFIGIFATMTPALLYLNAHAAELGLTEPWQYYYSTGALSSFLDNTPTAVAFYEVAHSAFPIDGGVAGISSVLMSAISLGAVFFGSMTYIGNGPNFMVKAIAEQEGVKMPSFFGYMLKFSLIVLLPVFIIVQLIFL